MTKESEKLVYETRIRLRQQREARRPLISPWALVSIGFGLVFLSLFFGLGLGIGIILGGGSLMVAQILNGRHRRRMAHLANQRAELFAGDRR